MISYQELKDGSLGIDGATIPNSDGNKDYRAAIKLVDSGTAEILPYSPPRDSRTYRDKRQERYTAELSPEGSFQKTVGDTIDALIKAIYGDRAELDALVVKINAIKDDIPRI